MRYPGRDVREVPPIPGQEKLYVKACKCALRPRGAGRPWPSGLGSGGGSGPAQGLDRTGLAVPPSNVELCRVVELCNFYRRCYADIATPLTRLCGPHAS